jgi:hypothetical protein
VNGLIPLPQQVTESGPGTLSRWRHGFEPRWDYAGQRPYPRVTRASGPALAPQRARGRHDCPHGFPLGARGWGSCRSLRRSRWRARSSLPGQDRRLRRGLMIGGCRLDKAGETIHAGGELTFRAIRQRGAAVLLLTRTSQSALAGKRSSMLRGAVTLFRGPSAIVSGHGPPFSGSSVWPTKPHPRLAVRRVASGLSWPCRSQSEPRPRSIRRTSNESIAGGV